VSNLIERLRDPLECPDTKSVFALCREAADEIERLQVVGRILCHASGTLADRCEKLTTENASKDKIIASQRVAYEQQSAEVSELRAVLREAPPMTENTTPCLKEYRRWHEKYCAAVSGKRDIGQEILDSVEELKGAESKREDKQ
jgi:hypothetical protein